MAAVKTPVEGYTGQVVGVTFADGVGETDDPAVLAYFRRHGYTVEETEKAVTVPEGKPSTDWTADQLKAYAAEHGIDLGAAKKKAEIAAALEAAEKAVEDAKKLGDGSTPTD